jgi:hypothetical protein
MKILEKDIQTIKNFIKVAPIEVILMMTRFRKS